MKRIMLVLVLLAVAGMAFSVSGKIFVRYGMYNEANGTPKIGAMWSFWGAPNNVDLWQNQPGGTGFEVNFDGFGLTYKTRDALPAYYYTPNRDGQWDAPFETPLATLYSGINGASTTYSDRFGWSSVNATDNDAKTGLTPATSPGYFQINKIKLGSIDFQAGLAWWTLHMQDKWFATNGVTTNVDYVGDVNFDKFYLDFKFAIPLSDSMQLKIVDWDLIWTEFYFGSSSVAGKYNTGILQFDGDSGDIDAAQTSQLTNNNSVGGFKAYVPLRFMWNVMDNLSLDISEKLIYDVSGYETKTIAATNKNDEFYFRTGTTLRATLGLSDSLALYLMAGYFYESATSFTRGIAGSAVVTNTDNVSAYNTVPLYGGLKVKVGPGISMNLGYGANFAINSTDTYYGAGRLSTNVVTYGTILRTGYMRNYTPTTYISAMNLYSQTKGKIQNAERCDYGDNLMDVAFMRFGGTAKFAQNWELNLAMAVSLNDAWTMNYIDQGSANYSYTTSSGMGATRSTYNWLMFKNWSSYDNQMYIKYEDDVVMIKGSVGMFPLHVTTTAPTYHNSVTARNNSIFGFFNYVDFAYKF